MQALVYIALSTYIRTLVHSDPKMCVCVWSRWQRRAMRSLEERTNPGASGRRGPVSADRWSFRAQGTCGASAAADLWWCSLLLPQVSTPRPSQPSELENTSLHHTDHLTTTPPGPFVLAAGKEGHHYHHSRLRYPVYLAYRRPFVRTAMAACSYSPQGCWAWS